jgi:hypothetical protein
LFAACAFPSVGEAKPPPSPWPDSACSVAAQPDVTYTWVLGVNSKQWTQTTPKQKSTDCYQVALKNVADMTGNLTISAGPSVAVSQEQCGKEKADLSIVASYKVGHTIKRTEIWKGSMIGSWNTGSGEFPKASCLTGVSQSVPIPSLLNGALKPYEVRILARAGHIDHFSSDPKFKPPYHADLVSVGANGVIPAPPSDHHVILDPLTKPTVPLAAAANPVTFVQKMKIDGFQATQKQIIVRYNYGFDICPVDPNKDTDKYCRLPAGSPAVSSVWPWCSGPAGFQCFDAWKEIPGGEIIRCSGDLNSPVYSTGNSMNIDIALKAKECQGAALRNCDANGLCADIRIKVTTEWNKAAGVPQADAPLPGQSWDRVENNYADKASMNAK